MKNEARKPLAPGFGVLLNILNIPQLRDKRYITTDTLESDVDDEGISLAQDLARNKLGVRSEVLGDVVVDGLEIGPSAGSR